MTMLATLAILTFALSAQAQLPKLSECKLSVYPVMSTGEVAKQSLLSPDHVVSIFDAGTDDRGAHVFDVTLTAEGAALNLAYGKSHLGEQMAVFCGDKEIVRPRISGTSTDRFRITIPRNSPDK